MNDQAKSVDSPADPAGAETAARADEEQAAAAAAEAGAENSKQGGLRALLLRSSAYEMFGYGASQAIRFASNLILTRLLFPQAFGLVALVNILNQGLVMLSDVGLPTVIIQSERGDDPRFLNTAYTWQVARSAGLWVIAVLFAWPMALIYKEPQLLHLVPVGSLAVMIMGFRSTAYYTLRRRLQLRPLMMLEMSSQLGAVLVMIPWALLAPSVWPLVGGTIVSAIIAAVGSHMLDVGYKNRFEWDRESAKSMFDFGKWIAGSSMLTFASGQGDRLMLGRFLGAAKLGVYSTAVFLSGALGEAITRITHGVFFPAYSRVRTEGHARLQQVYYRTRLAVDGVVITILGGLSALGPAVIQLLYDDRYHDAGWMLQLLALRVAISALTAPAQFLLIALGQTSYGFWLNLARTVALFGGVPIGFFSAGISGLVWAVALSEVPALLVVYYGVAREKLLSPLLELRVPLFFAGGFVLGHLVNLILQRFGPFTG